MPTPTESRPSVAVITPYYRESRAVIEQCIASVAAQTVPTAHILVADGYPQSWIDGVGVRHIILDRNYGNFGNTPRAIGLIAAIGEAFAAIALLDADNFFDADHVATCLTMAAHNPDADYVVARRRFIAIDGRPMALAEEPTDQHIDTNCFFFLPGSYAALPVWGLIPAEMSPISDRLFYAALRKRKLIAVETDKITVSYRVSIAELYETIGMTAPAGTKPRHDVDAIARWFAGLHPAARQQIERQIGVRFLVQPSV